MVEIRPGQAINLGQSKSREDGVPLLYTQKDVNFAQLLNTLVTNDGLLLRPLSHNAAAK
jgi:hypothetical protein